MAKIVVLFWVFSAIFLSACASSGNLTAVRLATNPVWSKDDQPRVSLNIVPDETVKKSFKYALDKLDCQVAINGEKAQLPPVKADSSTITPSVASPGPNPPSGASSAKNTVPKCVKQIAAYAVDQCVSLANTQNDIAGTTSILVGAAASAAALATDALALSNPAGGNKTADAALAAAVTSNAGGIPKLFPQPVSVKPSDIITAAGDYADAVGITADRFKCDTENSCHRDDKLEFDLARVHDAALSVCTAIAYHRIKKPKNVTMP